MILLTIVVPVFNEEESIKETINRLLSLKNSFDRESVDVEFMFVDDGSSDESLKILKESAINNNQIKIISFSRNFGHQIAITAGIDESKGDYVAIIDADLQDPPELIFEMYLKSLEGYDVVYGKRKNRAGETFFKKYTASLFYKFLNFMSETEIPRDTGDFRLINRKVVNALSEMRESHRFMRGMIPWIGFKEYALEYDRSERFAGDTKYPLKKMIQFAVNAILSFSSKPLTLAVRLGTIITSLGFMGGLYMLYLKIFTNVPIAGITSILLTVIIFSGIQIILIGLAGEYIARIFEEVKGRPLYFIDEKVNIDTLEKV
jgi:dolichol-phosphate mannosyltransferase